MSYEILLNENETLEDLQRSGFRLIQKKNGFRFGTDSVLLAAYTAEHYKNRHNKKLIAGDLCAGCGAVSFLLAARMPRIEISGFEIMNDSCRVYEKNMILNQTEERMHVRQADLSTIIYDSMMSSDKHRYDLITVNPPYQKPERNLSDRMQVMPKRSDDKQPEGNHKKLDLENRSPANAVRQRSAYWEDQLSLDQLLKAAAFLLKQKGMLFMVHKVHRLPEIFSELRSHKFEPVHMRMVQSLPDKAPSVFLMKARYLGKAGSFSSGPVFFVHDRPGVYSQEAALWYGHEAPLSVDHLWQHIRR